MIDPNPKSQPDLRRRSLAELDDVIDEIIERNPEFMKKLQKILAEKQHPGAHDETPNTR